MYCFLSTNTVRTKTARHRSANNVTPTSRRRHVAADGSSVARRQGERTASAADATIDIRGHQSCDLRPADRSEIAPLLAGPEGGVVKGHAGPSRERESRPRRTVAPASGNSGRGRHAGGTRRRYAAAVRGSGTRRRYAAAVRGSGTRQRYAAAARGFS